VGELLLLVAVAEVEELPTTPAAALTLLALLLARETLEHLFLGRQIRVVLAESRVDERGRVALVEQGREQERLPVREPLLGGKARPAAATLGRLASDVMLELQGEVSRSSG